MKLQLKTILKEGIVTIDEDCEIECRCGNKVVV